MKHAPPGLAAMEKTPYIDTTSANSIACAGGLASPGLLAALAWPQSWSASASFRNSFWKENKNGHKKAALAKVQNLTMAKKSADSVR